MLYAIPFFLKSLNYKSTFKMIKKLKGRKLRAPQKMKKGIFSILGGPVTSPHLIFQQIWGHFHKANFWSRKGSSKAICQKKYFAGSVFTQKVCFMIVPSDLLKNLRGGSYGAPQIWKKSFFSFFGGPVTFSPSLFSSFWGYFNKANFWSKKGSRKAFFCKITF